MSLQQLQQASNTTTLGFQYKFSILFEKVVINIGVPCKLAVIIKRGQQKIKLQNSPIICPQQKTCYFEEIIHLKTNVYWDTFNQIFWDKKISFTLVIESQNGNKLAGISSYNLSTFLNTKQSTVYEVLKLNKCPDPNAKLYVKFNQTLIKELGEVDQISSRNSIISDGFDDFHDITFSSSSNRSILQEKNEITSIIDQNNQQIMHIKSESNHNINNNNINQNNNNNLNNNNYITFNQNHPQNINHQQNNQSNHKNHIQSHQINHSNHNNKVNDENDHYQAQKININTNSNNHHMNQGSSSLNETQKLFILESHMKTMISEKEQLKSEILLLKQTIAIQSDNLSKKEEECKEYFDRYEDIKSQRDDIKQKLDIMKKETEKIENQVLGKIELMREDFCKQLNEKNKEIDYLTNQNNNLNTKVKELIQDNKTCSERILKNEQKMKEQQDELDRINFQSTKINHININNNEDNILIMTQEIESLQSQIKSYKDNIQRLEYNKKRKDEDINKFITEIHHLNNVNHELTQNNQMLLEQIQQLKKEKEQMIEREQEEQFISFIDKPSQIMQQNNQSMNMKSFMSHTQNEFHSCIVQDFDDNDDQTNNNNNVSNNISNNFNKQSVKQINNNKSQQDQDDQILQNKDISKDIRIKEEEHEENENSFEQQMKQQQQQQQQQIQFKDRIINDNKQIQSSNSYIDTNTTITSKSIISQNQISLKQDNNNNNNNIQEILQKYHNIEDQYINGKVKWEKIDKDNDTLKQQISMLNSKFQKMENQLEESKKGLHDALTLALKTGDKILINQLQNTLRQ